MSQERPIRLQAGPWSVEVERTTGWSRFIRLGGHEVARAVYANVRDETWRTMSQRVVHHRAAQEEGRFEAHWEIEFDELGFTWQTAVRCDGTTLSIEWLGKASQEFRTRRTGLCLLHPLELKGLPCIVGHSNGDTESGAFPFLVEPHQPFLDIRSISHSIGSAEVQIVFAGEVFEMEDQRNWIDASFKTYCRPQAWEQPYVLSAGETIHHGVRFGYQGQVVPVERPCVTPLTSSGRVARVPKLGTVGNVVPAGFEFALNGDNLGDWSAAGLGKVHFAGANFVDLNRNRPLASEFDAVAFGATPQTHAFDERTIMENVRGLVDAIDSAREISAGKPVCVGPIRFQNRRVDRDYRIDQPIGPAWLIATVLACAEGGAQACAILESGDFRGDLKEAAGLLSGVHEVELLDSFDCYRAIGFRLPTQKTILVNMRSVTTSVDFMGEHELEPYEIFVLP
jgi:hypothetical protein